MDIKNKIVKHLEMKRDAEMLQDGSMFKVRAYNNVIQQLQGLNDSVNIRSVADIKAAGVTGIGKSIEAKIAAALEGSKTPTQQLQQTQQNIEVDAFKEISKVHGIGAAKAKELIKKKITTIAQLRENQDLLNDVQKLGLKYFEDIEKRIPRKEMLQHETKLVAAFASAGFDAVLTGSFRREAATSGDIDVLVTGEARDGMAFRNVVDSLKTGGYISDILAQGDSKCMCLVRLPRHRTHRRLDILFTSPSEYPYALLYFTGSQGFNIGFRREALKQGHSLNEHGMKPAAPIEIKSEEDIFRFFNVPFVAPKDRSENIFQT